MANCHNLFGEFNTEISLTSNKKTKMTSSKDKLRERIRKYFKENHSEYIPKFYIHSYLYFAQGLDKAAPLVVAELLFDCSFLSSPSGKRVPKCFCHNLLAFR